MNTLLRPALKLAPALVLFTTLTTTAHAEPARAARRGPTPSPWLGSAARPKLVLAKAFGPGAPVAHAPPAPRGQEITVEVHDSRPGQARNVEQFSLPVAEHGAKIESRVGSTDYRLNVSREGIAPDAPLEIDLERSQRGGGTDVYEATVRASVRVAPGRRVVVARILRSDGSRTEVIASLK